MSSIPQDRVSPSSLGRTPNPVGGYLFTMPPVVFLPIPKSIQVFNKAQREKAKERKSNESLRKENARSTSNQERFSRENLRLEAARG
jgi:hypothetical protein